jgi:hypothetical protein
MIIEIKVRFNDWDGTYPFEIIKMTLHNNRVHNQRHQVWVAKLKSKINEAQNRPLTV